MDNDQTIEVLNVLHELSGKVEHITGSIDKKIEGISNPNTTYVSANAGALATCAMLLRAQNSLLNDLVEKMLTEKDQLQVLMDAFNEKKKE